MKRIFHIYRTLEHRFECFKSKFWLMLGTIALKTHSYLFDLFDGYRVSNFFYLVVLWDSSAHDCGVWREN